MGSTTNSGSRQERTDDRLGEDRAMQDRSITDNRDLTDMRRLEAFRQQFFQSALPDLQKIPGYHVCWLTTTDSRDPVHGRIRIGYELIKASDMPGWEHSSLKSGDYAGCIGVNEMLAAKIRLELYELYMRENHHNAPLGEEEKLQATSRAKAEELAKQGAQLIIEEGQSSLGRQLSPPSFAEMIGEGLASGGS